MDHDRAIGRTFRLNRLVVFLIALSGALVAYVPVLVTAGHTLFLIYIAAISLVVLIFTSWRVATDRDKRIPGVEMALSAWHSMFYPTLTALILLIIAGLVLGGAALFDRLFDTSSNGRLIALWVTSIIALGLVPLALSLSIEDIQNYLFPDRAGVSTRFSEFVNPYTIWWLTFGFVVLLAVLAASIFLGWIWLNIVFLALALFASALVSPDEEPSVTENSIERVEEALHSAEYDTVRKPVTGDESVDPMLSTLEFFAFSEDRRIAVKIVSEGLLGTEQREAGTGSDLWVLGSLVVSAADALSDFVDPPDPPVEPVLIVVDLEVDASLHRYTESTDLIVLRIDTSVEGAYELHGPFGDLEGVAASLASSDHDPQPPDVTSAIRSAIDDVKGST